MTKKTKLGNNDVTKCYIGSNEADTALLGALGVCKKAPPPAPRFEVRVWAPTQADAMPAKTIPGLVVTDNSDGSYSMISKSTIVDLHGTWKKNNKITRVDVIHAEDLRILTNTWEDCTSLASFDTIGLTAATDVSAAWNSCPITSFDTSSLTSVTNAKGAWAGCKNLVSFDTSGLTSLIRALSAWMNCEKLTSFDTTPLSSLEDATHAWSNCDGLTSFDTSGLTSLISAKNAWSHSAGYKSFDTTGLTSVTDASYAWNQCSITLFDTVGLTAVTNAEGMLSGCRSLKSCNARGLTSAIHLKKTWFDCASLKCITSLVAPAVIDVENAFQYSTGITHPNAAEQTAHFTTSGVNWTNPNPCP